MTTVFHTNCFMISGSVLRCDVTGKILMKCFLSGMPDLKLGLNDKIGLEKESQIKSRPTKRLFSCVVIPYYSSASGDNFCLISLFSVFSVYYKYH